MLASAFLSCEKECPFFQMLLCSLLLMHLPVRDRVSLVLTKRSLRKTGLFYRKVPSFSICRMMLNAEQMLNLQDVMCAKLTYLTLDLKSGEPLPFGFADKFTKMRNLVYLKIQLDKFAGPLELTLPVKIQTFICRYHSRLQVTNVAECDKLRVLKLQADLLDPFKIPPDWLLKSRLHRFPEGLEFLRFDTDCNFPVDALPPGLKFWDCGLLWNHPLPPMPETLHTLELSADFTGSLEGLPTNLRNLTIRQASIPEFMRILTTRRLTNLRKLHIYELLTKAHAKHISQNVPNLSKLKVIVCGDIAQSLHLPFLQELVFETWASGGLASFTHFSHLKRLRVCIHRTTKIFLPESIRSCKIYTPESDVDIIITHLPAGLKTLNLYATKDLVIPKLNEGIAIVDISCALWTQIDHFPRSLRVFRVATDQSLDLNAPFPNMDFFQCDTWEPEINDVTTLYRHGGRLP